MLHGELVLRSVPAIGFALVTSGAGLAADKRVGEAWGFRDAIVKRLPQVKTPKAKPPTTTSDAAITAAIRVGLRAGWVGAVLAAASCVLRASDRVSFSPAGFRGLGVNGYRNSLAKIYDDLTAIKRRMGS
jgi:hypothetical protein